MATTSSGNPRFAPVADVSGTYIPFGLDRLNDLAVVTRSINWTNSTTGNVTDDKIITEFAGYFFDSHLSSVQVDPESGQPMNKHWEQAMMLLNSRYGVMQGGTLMAPLYAREERAAIKIARVDASSADADSGVPNL